MPPKSRVERWVDTSATTGPWCIAPETPNLGDSQGNLELVETNKRGMWGPSSSPQKLSLKVTFQWEMGSSTLGGNSEMFNNPTT